MIKHIDSRGEEQVAFFGGTMAVSNKYTYNLTTHGINDGDLVQFGSYNAGCSDNWYPHWYRYDSRNANQIHFNLIGTAFKTWFELNTSEAPSPRNMSEGQLERTHA